MPQPGRLNLITDIPGIRVGHATDAAAASGVTVLLLDQAWPAAVDIRGGAPGERETAALAPENLVGAAHAVVLSGGSVFGLAAADGVAALLSQQGVGLTLRPGAPPVPVVPGAVLFDLANDGDKNWGLTPPYRALGLAAAAAAGSDFALGSVGAGRGAMAGLVKGGVGSASLDLGDGVVVGALVAANPVGSALMPDGHCYWAWPFEINAEFGGRRPQGGMPAVEPLPELSRLERSGRLQAGGNTTIAVVAASVALTTAECLRVAIMAQDGLSRAIRPAHTPFDGDTVFALAHGEALPPGGRSTALARIGSAAADCLCRAIARALYHA
jgi:L-aminopeptidase/D-esterase-like protein